MKKLFAIALVVLMILTMAACGKTEKDAYTIGICQLTTHPALDAATKGFQDAVTKG